MNKLLFSFLIFLGVCYSCRKENTPPVVIKDPDYKRAKSFLNRKNDSAFYYFNQVVTKAKDSLQVAYAYNYMAMMQSDVGDYFGSQESLTASLKFLDPQQEKDRQGLASNYNELGLTSIDLKNYDAAIEFFDKAIPFTPDSNYRLIYLNNKALAYQKKKAYSQALAIYQAIIRKTTDRETYARVLTNMATTKWLDHPSYHAAPELLSALRIREREQDRWGQNSSYAHLADYYAVNRLDSAYYYAAKMYQVARKLGSPDDQLEALEKLIRVGPIQKVRPYFKRYHLLGDSLQTARNIAKNQFAFIRYEVEKSKADNLKLQKENTDKKYQLIRQSVRFYSSLLVFLLVAGGAVFWYRKRRKQQAQETENAVQETRRKASKKVHDTLANDIYRIMKKVQHEPSIDKGWLLNNIEDVYKRSRDISYEIIQHADDQFPEKIAELLKYFATETIKVVLVGNDAEFWKQVDSARKFELKYILQELMVNMQKHSKATQVVLKFQREADQMQITYFDNGVGFGSDVVPKNGLQNTENRINGIGGQITFGNDAGEGLQIRSPFRQ